MEKLEKMEISENRSPKIFLSGSIRGGRQLLETYRFMFDTLEEAGAEVLSWHVADPELEKTEMKMTEEEISDFNETFEELRSLKSFDASNAESFFEKAYRIIDKSTPNESAVKKTEAIANVMATNS